MSKKKTNSGVFLMPNAVKIKGRTSSITNSFVNGIIPVIQPTDEEVKEALEQLGMTETNICCAYCGDKMTEWDHFRPLVHDKGPTGYISEIYNLVPACGKCNQSKGNQNWEEWITGDAKLSPKTRKVKDLNDRIKALNQYENWSKDKVHTIDMGAIVGADKWKKHWDNCASINQMIDDAQKLSDELREIINSYVLTGLTAKSTTTKSTTTICESTKPTVGRKVGEIVKKEFVSLLQSGAVADEDIMFLQNAGYSKKYFDVNYPILIELKDPADYLKKIDARGYSRYYSKKINIKGKDYLITSQWLERSRNPLVSWIENKKKDMK